MHIEDDSGDRKYFTIIPNYILNHSTANDQALYLQMKRIAGEKGTCEAGYRYFTKQLGIGQKGYIKALTYLLDHKWISFVGKKQIMTQGGVQSVNVYKVNDLWELNNQHFSSKKKGGIKSNHLSSKVVSKGVKGGAESMQKKNQEEDKGASSLGAMKTHEEIQKFDEISKGIKDLLKRKRI